MSLKRALKPFYGKVNAALEAEANRLSKILNSPGLPIETAEELLSQIVKLIDKSKALMDKRRERSAPLSSRNVHAS